MKKKKPATHISKDDLTELIIISSRTEVARANAESAAFQEQMHEAKAEIDLIKMQEQIAKKLQQAKNYTKLLKDTREAAYKNQRDLAATLADRYNFDTQKAAVNTLTGEIVPLNLDEE